LRHTHANTLSENQRCSEWSITFKRTTLEHTNDYALVHGLNVRWISPVCRERRAFISCSARRRLEVLCHCSTCTCIYCVRLGGRRCVWAFTKPERPSNDADYNQDEEQPQLPMLRCLSVHTRRGLLWRGARRHAAALTLLSWMMVVRALAEETKTRRRNKFV